MAVYADSIQAKVNGTAQAVPLRDSDAQQQLATKAPGIIETASGESIQIADSSNLPLAGLRIYGKATQDGTPSPESPVPIEIAGSGGTVNISITGGTSETQSLQLSTPNGLPGIPVSSGGNYTDASGHQWVCDEIDFKRGKYVQRVKKRELLASGNWLTSGSQLRQYVRLDDAETGIYSPIISNYFKMGIWTNDNVGTICLGDGYDPLCGVSTKDFESVEAIKTWLREKSSAGNPCYVIYKLLTPIETDLTTEQLTALKQLRTYQTITNIATDDTVHPGMEVDYVADTKLYIDNKVSAAVTQAVAIAQA